MKLHGLSPEGVLHIGAHKAEEAHVYVNHGFAHKNPIIWVEAQEDLVAALKAKMEPKLHKVYNAVAWDKTDEELEFHITSKSASSSLFDLSEHQSIYPDITVDKNVIVKTTRLDEVIDSGDVFDFVVLDIQGAEFQALSGLGDLLNGVKWIFTEVSKRELYKGATRFDDLDTYLYEQGFKRVFTAWDRKAGWGDAFYVRRELYKPTHKQLFLITVSKVRRYSRSLVPQALFPLLVRLKRKFLKFTQKTK